MTHDTHNIFDRFHTVALATPDRIAVRAPGETATFGQLLDRALDIAAWLGTQDLNDEATVGVLMARRWELPAVLLGCLAAGCVYVPLDPRDPVQRHADVLGQTQCDIGVGDRLHIEALRAKDAGAALFALDDIGARSADPILPKGRSDGLAYLLSTSGSTGTPKPVEVEHGNVLAVLDAAAQLLDFTAQDRYLATSTLAFDAAVLELFLPLTTGACVVLRDRDLLLDPERFAHDIAAEGVTIAQTTPSVWAVILAAQPRFPSLRVLVTHGEAVTPVFAADLARRFDRVLNIYGPTETTVWACAHRLAPEVEPTPAQSSAPIGCGLAHVKLHVMDENLSPIEDGQAGELVISGPGVARGYRNRPGETARSFVQLDGARAYRTGDRVIRDTTGVHHYLGRIDDQMQINGVRIEPGEVEAALRADPSVAQTAVTWMQRPDGSHGLLAAVVCASGYAQDASSLRERLAMGLRDTHLPARIVFVEALPVTSNGKIDRAALRDLAGDAHHGTIAQNETEAKIQAIWQNVLGSAVIAPDASFFTSGGDSLAAVTMTLAVEDEFDVDVSAHLVFEHPVLSDYASAIDALGPGSTAPSGWTGARKRSGTGAPLFFALIDAAFADGAGQALPCPVFALNLWRPGEGLSKMPRLEDLAAEHVIEIRAAQPDGPYRLAGYSVGALLVQEIARQLTRDGAQVDVLFLLDPAMPGWLEDAQGRRRLRAHPRDTVGARLTRLVAGPGVRGWRAWLRDLVPVPQPSRLQMWWAAQQVNRHLKGRKVSDLNAETQHRAFFFAMRRVIDAYTARPATVPSIVLTTTKDTRAATWHHLAGPQGQAVHLDADHRALFHAPHVTEWTPRLAAALEDG